MSKALPAEGSEGLKPSDVVLGCRVQGQPPELPHVDLLGNRNTHLSLIKYSAWLPDRVDCALQTDMVQDGLQGHSDLPQQ